MNGHCSTLAPRICPLWLEYLIFTFLVIFHQRSSKLSLKTPISSQNAETWNRRYFRNYETERPENLTQSCERKMQFSDAIWWRHNKSNMADWRHIESSSFWLYLSVILGRSTRNLEQRWRITCRYIMSRDQSCNFRKFSMADGRHFENSIISISQPIIIRCRSNSVVWWTFQFSWWTFNKKIEILQIQDGGRTSYWKSFLLDAPWCTVVYTTMWCLARACACCMASLLGNFCRFWQC